MSIKFESIEGEAKKLKVEYYKFENGENRFRMVGDVLPRYNYWIRTPSGDKTMPLECLSFSRDSEKFDNKEKDWVEHFFPDAKCSWSYAVKAYNSEGRLVVLALKKKLFQSILSMAEKHLGDPTHPDDGWECVVEREKTGSAVYNVSYTLDQLSSKKLPLTDEQKEEVANSLTIDELLPRPSSDEVKAFIERVWFSTPDDEEIDDESIDELDDDI